MSPKQENWRKDAVGNSVRISLPHNETDERKVYSFPNPMYLSEACWSVRYRVIPGIADKQLRADVGQVLAMAEAYRDLTANVLGQERAVGKLRDIWRARRALPDPNDTEAES